ncbi:MAG: ABC transporter ATP-binding protein [Candidatus Nanopelagicales bacterium]
MTPPPAVSVAGLSKRFRMGSDRRDSFKERLVKGRGGRTVEFWALRDVSFEVPRGSFFGVIGHNGSGKSTTLKILAGIYRPTSGTVRTQGRVSALLELGAGFHPELTGRENVYLNGAILGLSRRQIDESMDSIIDFADIGDFIDAPVKVFSSGMSVRLGFAVAAVTQPDILIVDEVIAVGDEEFQRKCFDHLFDLRRRGATIILVTHAMSAVESMCDHAIWLDHGQVAASGTAADVVRDYVGSVNRAEAERAGSSGQSGSEMTRSGSGGIRVDRLEALGSGSTFLEAGAPARLRLHYEADRDIPACHAGITFHHESGATVAHCVTWDEGPFAVEAGTGYFDFLMDPVLLEPASYWVSTTLAIQGHVFDRLDRGFTLPVRGDGTGGGGLVALPGRWSRVPI